MSYANQQILYTIVAIIITLLFLGILFLIMLLNMQNRKRRFIQEKQLLEAAFNQQLLQSQLEIQEQTFNTISQEIHDNVGQSLSLAKMQLHLLDRREAYNKPLIIDTTNSISKAINDLRDLAKGLNTNRIHQSTLQDIISQELLRIKRPGLMDASLQAEGEEPAINNQKKLILFRIVQEALQNILKHSAASQVHVTCRYGDTDLHIMVSDNGKGFDKNNIGKKDGLGLSNIVHRAALIGGEAMIESIVDGGGTTVSIHVPYK